MPLGLLKSAKNYAGQRQKAYSGEAVKCEKVAMSESASSQRLLPPLTSPEEATVNWSTSVLFYQFVPTPRKIQPQEVLDSDKILQNFAYILAKQYKSSTNLTNSTN